jgi:predicted nucleic acid-binding protein
MIFFLDSSALVKRYVAETGTAMVTTLIENEPNLAVSWLALPETLAAITRRLKGFSLSDADLTRVKAQLALDWQKMLVIAVTGAPINGVETLIARHALRGADNVHLASALWLEQTTKTPVTFVAADTELLAAAGAEGLATINPGTN